MAVGITEQLAIHTARVRYEDIPPEAIQKAKDCILDQIGVELIGSTLEWNKIAYRYVAQNRYRVFGKYETCMLPDPNQRSRFLDV